MATNSPGVRWLLAAGIGSMLVGVLHIEIIFAGASAYRYFGAGSMVPLLERGSYLPALITSVFACVFVLWGLYAFSGAKIIRPLPLLRPALYVIGGIYTLRGVAVGLDLYFLLIGKHAAPHKTAFSAVSLILGLCYLIGVWKIQSATDKIPIPQE